MGSSNIPDKKRRLCCCYSGWQGVAAQANISKKRTARGILQVITHHPAAIFPGWLRPAGKRHNVAQPNGLFLHIKTD